MNRSSIILTVAIGFSVVCLAIIFTHKSKVPQPVFVQAIDSLVSVECYDEFGIDAEGYDVIKGKIRPNEFLSDILLPMNIPYASISNLAEKSKSVFDIRKLNSGKNYTIIRSTDSLKKALYFIYEASPVDFVVYDLTDTISIYKGSRPTKLESRSI